MSARFEIVHTDSTQPYHARWIAENGETVWWTEKYARKIDAETAVFLLGGGRVENGHMTATLEPHYPVIYVDERTDNIPTDPLF